MQIKLDWDIRVEVRRYPSLADSSTFDEGIYRLGATVRDSDGVTGLALERETEDGRTEVLRLRLLGTEQEST